jgi:hypothetical protein
MALVTHLLLPLLAFAAALGGLGWLLDTLVRRYGVGYGRLGFVAVLFLAVLTDLFLRMTDTRLPPFRPKYVVLKRQGATTQRWDILDGRAFSKLLTEIGANGVFAWHIGEDGVWRTA